MPPIGPSLDNQGQTSKSPQPSPSKSENEEPVQKIPDPDSRMTTQKDLSEEHSERTPSYLPEKSEIQGHIEILKSHQAD